MSHARAIGGLLCIVAVGTLWYLIAHGSGSSPHYTATPETKRGSTGSSQSKPSPLVQVPPPPPVATAAPAAVLPDVPSAPAPLPPTDTPPAAGVSFTADRKGFSNGCKGGTLTLAPAAVSFVCPSDPGKGFSATLAQVRGPDDDGIQLVSGEKFHFKIEDRDKETMRSLFATWYARAHGE